jgi:hypothetical protein
MINFVMKIASMANEWWFSRIRRTIAIYVERNNVAHSHVGELARQGKYLQLANMMVDDLRALADSPPSCCGNVGIAKQAILTTAKKYFAVFDWDDEADELSTAPPKPSNPSRKKRRENRWVPHRMNFASLPSRLFPLP